MMPKSDQTATVESLLGNSKRQAVLIQHEASCNRKFSSCFFVLHYACQGATATPNAQQR